MTGCFHVLVIVCCVAVVSGSDGTPSSTDASPSSTAGDITSRGTTVKPRSRKHTSDAKFKPYWNPAKIAKQKENFRIFKYVAIVIGSISSIALGSFGIYINYHTYYLRWRETTHASNEEAKEKALIENGPMKAEEAPTIE